MAITVVDVYSEDSGDVVTFQSLTTVDLTTVATDNLLVMVGTDSLTQFTRRDLMADGWQLFIDDASYSAVTLWYALKRAIGDEELIDLYFDMDFCSIAQQRGYAAVVELGGAALVPVSATSTATGAPQFSPVTMGGQSIVFAAVVTDTDFNPQPSPPSGYDLVDTWAATCPNHRFYLWSKDLLVGGVEDPSNIIGSVANHRSLVLGIHAIEANITELGLLDISPMHVASLHNNGSDVGVIDVVRDPDVNPLPPEPTETEIPVTPPWRNEAE